MRGQAAPIPKRETLGARLVSRGAVTQAQVDEAIEAQVIFGGRIGTNLLELGYLDEDTLNAVLAEQHHVPPLPPGFTDPEPTPETLTLIPAELVAEYRVVPLRLEGRRLQVLMENPSDLAQLDDLAFRTGYIIKPQVAGEARIAWLLERYFGIRRGMRYIMLSREGGQVTRERMHESLEVEAASVGIEETHWESDEMIQRELRPWEDPPVPEEDLIPEDIHVQLTGYPPPEAPPLEATPPEKAPAEARRPEAAPPEAAPAKARPLEEARPPEPPPQPPPAIPMSTEAFERELTREFEEGLAAKRVLTLEDAAARLAAAEERNDVARALLDFTRGRCRRAALVILQREMFLGWDGRGEGVNVASLRELRLPADEPSVLRTASTTRSHLVTAVSDAGYARADTALLSVLGGGVPQAALLVPMIVKDRVVAVLYADNGDGAPPPEDVGGLVSVAEQVPRAFANLLRKRRAMVV